MPEVLSDSAPGVAEAMAAAFNPKPAVAAPAAAPAPETKPADAPAPETKPAAAAPEAKPAAPAAKKDFTDDEIALARKEKPDHKAWKILDSVKARASQTETQLKSELAKLQAKPNETPADTARIEQLQKLIDEKDGEVKTWKQRVEEADFTRSEEYTTKYVQPYQNEKRRALDEVKKLTFRFTDTDGVQQTRPANEADFEKAMSLGASEQDEYLEAAFGKSAWRITNRINELERIRSASIQATQDFSTNYEKNKVARELEAKRQRETYEKELGDAYTGFQKDPEIGRYVSEAEDDPDGTKLYKSELEKFDGFKTVQPTAADAATVRARYAMAPRLLHVTKQQQAKIASLEADLAKFRGADPGGEVKTATGGTQPEAELGVEGKIKSMSWDGKAR